MSRFFKSAAFPIIIVIVLAFFASKLIGQQDQAEKTTFAQFLTQIEDGGSVKSVALNTKDNSADVTLTNDKKYEIGYPPEYAEILVNKLRAAETADNIQ